MKKLALLMTLALPLSAALTSCGSGSSTGTLPDYNNVSVHVTDGSDVIDVVRTTVPADATTGTPASVKWAPGAAGYATFNFTAEAGSDAVRITGFRIIKDTIAGKDVTASSPTVKSMYVYVPSGYSCTNQSSLASLNQSCSLSDSSTAPATGITSTDFLIDLTSPLVPYVENYGASVRRSVDIEFTGTSSRNQVVTVVAHGVVATGNLIDQ